MCRWERHLGSKERISYAQWLPEVFDELKQRFIQWVSDLGKPYEGRLEWWMARLSGRNPMQTPIFLHICYLELLHKKLISDLHGECLIVCEDWFLLQTIETNLKSAGYSTRRARFWQVRFIFAALSNLLEAFARWGYALGYQLVAWLLVKTLFRKKAVPALDEKKRVIIHTCVDEACLGVDGKFHDRYFSGLSEWLEIQGYQVLIIPWLFNLRRPLVSTYWWLTRSADKFLIPENHLRFSDYVSPIWELLKSGMILSGEYSFSGFKITPLIRRERWANKSAAGLIRFLLYIPFFKRWRQVGNSCDIFIDMFENMPCERPLISAIRMYSPDTLIIGYQHASIPGELMGYFVTADEWACGIFPDRIVTNGPASADILASAGFPEGAIIPGPALRYRYLFDWTGSKAGPAANRAGEPERILTVLLPLDVPAAVELLLGVARIADNVAAADMHIELKIHPMLPNDTLLRAAGLLALPTGWRWAMASMHDQLDRTEIAIGMGTAALLDAAAAGVPVICLGRELGFSFNPLEYWCDKYPICRTVSPLELAQRFNELMGAKDRESQFQLRQVSLEILHGLGRLDDEYFKAFVTP